MGNTNSLSLPTGVRQKEGSGATAENDECYKIDPAKPLTTETAQTIFKKYLPEGESKLDRATAKHFLRVKEPFFDLTLFVI